MRRVLRYLVPVDDQAHKIPVGKVVGVNAREYDKLEVWVEVEALPDKAVEMRKVRVYGTGHRLDLFCGEHLGMSVWQGTSGVSARLVWHLYSVGD